MGVLSAESVVLIQVQMNAKVSRHNTPAAHHPTAPPRELYLTALSGEMLNKSYLRKCFVMTFVPVEVVFSPSWWKYVVII